MARNKAEGRITSHKIEINLLQLVFQFKPEVNAVQ